MWHGGHKDVTDNLCYITVGTGVGIGLIINGKQVTGMIHPEGGHACVPILDADKEKYPNFKGSCVFHKNKCIDGLCTNTAIMKRMSLNNVDEIPNLPDDDQIWDFIGHYIGTMCSNLFLTLSL